MKQTFRRLTALTAAAVTLLSVVSIPASAYSEYYVTSSNYTNLSNKNPSLTNNGYFWWTRQQQLALPMFTTNNNNNFLPSRNSVTVTFKSNLNCNTTMLGTLDTSIISRTKLDHPTQAAQARKTIDKLSAKVKNGSTTTSYALKLEFEESSNSNVNEFGLRFLDDYTVRNELSRDMYLDDYTVNYNTGKYSGRLCFDEFYLAGMRVSSSDSFTTFEKPVLTWDEDYKCPMVYVDFHGQIPSPFTEYYDIPVLSDLTVSYNGGYSSYTTNNFEKFIYQSELVGC